MKARQIILNPDGTLNYDNVIEYFNSDEFSFEELAQTPDGKEYNFEYESKK